MRTPGIMSDGMLSYGKARPFLLSAGIVRGKVGFILEQEEVMPRQYNYECPISKLKAL